MISSQERIARLQSLLERVQRNAARPRVRAAAPAPAVTQPEPPPGPEEELDAMDEPVVAAPEVVPPEPPPEETSMVRAIEEPAQEVQIEAGEASIEDLDLLEDEIVDITDAGAPQVPDEAEPAEEPPASSRRPIAGSMGEALAGAAEAAEMDEGREIPLKTPPPESGPQAAPPPQGIAAPPVPEIAEAREAEVVSGTQPTAAQLGATIELEPSEPAELELGEPVAEAPPVHLVREEAPMPQAVEAEVVRRPAVAPAAPAGAFVTAARTFQPQSFAELLDASLSLGR